MTSRRQAALGAALERLYLECRYDERVGRDALRYPGRYPDPRDREAAALVTACLAYGRVDLFGRAVEHALGGLGAHPAAALRAFEPGRDAARFGGFAYRFNRPDDLVRLAVGYRTLVETHGSLERAFLAGDPGPEAEPEAGPEAEPEVGPAGGLGPALEAFAGALYAAGMRVPGRPGRGFRHLLPLPSSGGPCKRWNLFLRWMVRRRAPDFGLWSSIDPARLLVPVDTHVERMSRALGLTRRRSRTWRMAEEITRTLAAFDPVDPVKYDFALCHKRMSGECRDRRDPGVCAPCGLRVVCRHWRSMPRAAAGEVAEPAAREAAEAHAMMAALPRDRRGRR